MSPMQLWRRLSEAIRFESLYHSLTHSFTSLCTQETNNKREKMVLKDVQTVEMREKWTACTMSLVSDIKNLFFLLLFHHHHWIASRSSSSPLPSSTMSCIPCFMLTLCVRNQKANIFCRLFFIRIIFFHNCWSHQERVVVFIHPTATITAAAVSAFRRCHLHFFYRILSLPIGNVAHFFSSLCHFNAIIKLLLWNEFSYGCHSSMKYTYFRNKKKPKRKKALGLRIKRKYTACKWGKKNVANDVDLVCCLFCIPFQMYVCVWMILHSRTLCIHPILNGKQYHQCGLKLLDLSNRLLDFRIYIHM